MKKSIVLPTVIICSLNTLMVGYCATPNDVREFIGMDSLSGKYSEEDRVRIKAEYEDIERHNKLVQLLIDSNGDRSVLDAEIDKEIAVVKVELEDATNSFYDAFNRESVDVVKVASTNLSNVEAKLDSIKKKGEEIPVELKENTLVASYVEILRIEDLLSKEKDIGVVGNALKSPLEIKFDLVEPFGSYRDKEGKVIDSKSVKIRGTEVNNVISLWGGTVKSVTPTVDGLCDVVVEHSEYMQTKYSNIKGVKVVVGQTVTQYTYLGKLGKLKDASYPYLKLEVLMDGVNINPMYFFGKVGVNAIKEYTSKSGSTVDMNVYADVKEGIDGDVANGKPIYDKTGDVEDGAIVPSLNGTAPKPKPGLLPDEVEDDITDRKYGKGRE